jgi:hypothetical protein
MRVYEMIQLLATVCRYGAHERVFIRVGNKNIPMRAGGIDAFIGSEKNGDRERILVLVPEGNDYYGE